MFRTLDLDTVRDVLTRWRAGEPLRSITRSTGLDRKTVRRYVRTAQAVRIEANEVLEDSMVQQVTSIVRRPRARTTEVRTGLDARRERIREALASRMSLRRVHKLLAVEGLSVSYATLRRFAISELGYQVRTREPRALEAAA